jgi:N-acyl-D-amino-acid deacylase
MSQAFDVLIRGAHVYDGCGGQPMVADVAINGDRIAAIGNLESNQAKTDIEARGLALSPGFIDAHTHDDYAALSHPDMGFKSRGGVTTCIVGNCGFGAAPYDQAVQMLGALAPGADVPEYVGHRGYADALEAVGPGVNIGVLAGHGTIRMAAMGTDNRVPTDAEMAAMRGHLREALEAGVLGMSTGLIYNPGRYANTDELVELARLMHGTGAIYATHMRDEGVSLLESVSEAITIGERAGVGVQISHHKASGRESWGLVSRSLALIEAAQRDGQDVHADQYPYTAGSTSMQAILENGAFSGEGGMGSLRGSDAVVASAPGRAQWEGQSVADLAAASGESERETGERVARESSGATVVLHMMSEEDVQSVLRHPSTMIGSDGIPTLDGRPHPRLYNSFARVLGHYSRDIGLFDLSTALYRMCGFPANKFGLVDRGVIKEGAYADLVVFDANEIVDKGTFEDPNQYPIGIHHVFVNGQPAVRDGKLMGERHGRVIRRAGT